jgi:hypothetical protein
MRRDVLEVPLLRHRGVPQEDAELVERVLAGERRYSKAAAATLAATSWQTTANRLAP